MATPNELAHNDDAAQTGVDGQQALPHANNESLSAPSDSQVKGFSDMCSSMRLCDRLVFMLTVNPDLLPDDPALRGCVFQDQVRAISPSSGSIAKIVFSVTHTFFIHIASELRYLIFPLFGMCLPTVVSYLAFSIIEAPSNYEGSKLDMVYDNDLNQGRRQMAFLLLMFSLTLACWLTPFAVTLSLFTWRPQVRMLCPWSLSSFVLNSIFNVLAFILSRSSLLGLGFLTFVCYVCIHFYKCARLFDVGILRYLSYPTIGGVLIIYILRTTYEKLLDGPETFKAVFVTVINPLLMELLLILPARMIARSFRHNHPSTSFVSGIFLLFVKQVLGRTMVCLISDATIVAAISFCNMVTEFLMRISLRKRDALVYQKCLRRRTLNIPHADEVLGDHGSTTILRHTRSRLLRAHNAMLETLGEFIAVFNGTLLVLLWDISLDGENAVNICSVFPGALVQVGMELATDYVTAVVLKLDGIPIMELANGRSLSWSFPIAIAAALASGANTQFILVRAFCVTPKFDAARYILCLKAQALQ